MKKIYLTVNYTYKGIEMKADSIWNLNTADADAILAVEKHDVDGNVIGKIAFEVA